jgi:hypothetical protein
MQDARGQPLLGSFEVRRGVITVIASDGRTKTANVDEALLNTETLARSLLVLLQNEKQQTARAVAASEIGEKSLYHPHG